MTQDARKNVSMKDQIELRINDSDHNWRGYFACATMKDAYAILSKTYPDYVVAHQQNNVDLVFSPSYLGGSEPFAVVNTTKVPASWSITAIESEATTATRRQA